MVWPRFKVSGLAKTILQGTVKRKRKKGRQKKRLKHNIKEWIGMDFASSVWIAESRTRWKVICGAPMTFQGYGINWNRIECPATLARVCRDFLVNNNIVPLD